MLARAGWAEGEPLGRGARRRAPAPCGKGDD
jgi:hypothetical protein